MNPIAARLAEPFPPHMVSFRVGPTTKDKTRGMALAYIDARDVMRRLDDVCGPENWQNEYPWSDGKRVVCRIGIKIDGEWIWKTDGAGDTDTEGEKGALSDAFKRSAVHWGIGRYLYDVDAPWVAIEQKGTSYVIAASELPRLRSRLPFPRGAVPAHPTQEHEGDPFADPPPAPANSPASHGPTVTKPTSHSDHPRRQDALDAYGRIKKAIDAARSFRQLDALVENATKSGELALIKEVHAESYELLMDMAEARKNEMRAAA